jgi:hypothetical protein
MVDKVSPKFHAEIIVVLFDEYQDLRKVTDRVGILLSDASAEHIEAVGKYLPVDLMRVLPSGRPDRPFRRPRYERRRLSRRPAAE